MIPVLNKVVSKFDERLINISYVFEHPESITNQSLSYEAHVLRELKDMKVRTGIKNEMKRYKALHF